jgi:hypothetical protein
MEKKPLYVDADPDDARLQPVPPPPVAVAQSDVNQYIGEKQRGRVCEPSLPALAAAMVSSSRVALRAGEARPRHALVFRRIRCSRQRRARTVRRSCSAHDAIALQFTWETSMPVISAEKACTTTTAAASTLAAG